MLYLYDAVTAQIVAQTKTEEWDMLDFYSYKDGYCAIGVPKSGLPYADAEKEGEQMVGFSFEGEEGEMECLCVFYDNVLKETRRMVLNDIVSTAALAEWTVSHDGTRLAYCDNWEGMNLRHRKRKVRLPAVNLPSPYCTPPFPFSYRSHVCMGGHNDIPQKTVLVQY